MTPCKPSGPSSTPTRHARFKAATVALAGLLLVACGGGGDSAGGPPDAPAAAERIEATLARWAVQPLSSAEAEGLVFMREEERLAWEIYTAAASRYPQTPVFANIAASETTHLSAVKALLDRYRLADPLTGLAAGTYRDATLQALADRLAAQTATGLLPALQAGLLIEETDIHDLETRRAAADNGDILMVYDNLSRGSRNHLRSFHRTLLALGGSYAPQVLPPAQFDAIVNSPMETGR